MVHNEVITNIKIDLTKVDIIDLPKPEQKETVIPAKYPQKVIADKDKDLVEVLVEGVTSGIDENIKPENIKLGVNILGIEGNVAPDKPDQEKTIYPSEEEQVVVADLGYELEKVIAKPVETESFEIVPSDERQVVRASEGKYIKEVSVEAVEDISGEVAEQEILLAELETQVNELSDKPKDMLQARVDADNSCAYLFYNYEGESLDFIKDLDTSNATSLNNAFYGCKNAKVIDVSNFKTQNVQNMGYTFYNCKSVEVLDVSNFVTDNVDDMTSIFMYCWEVETLDLSNFNTSKVKSLKNAFYECYGLTELDLSSFSYDSMTIASGMLHSCNKLLTVNLGKFKPNSIELQGAFQGCTKLENITYTEFDTRNVTNISRLFYGNSYLVETPPLDLRSITSASNQSVFIHACPRLTTLRVYNVKWSLQIGSGSGNYGKILTDDSIINTFKELHDLTGGTAQTLTLSNESNARTEAIYVKLIDITDEMRAEDDLIDYKKPCVVCESTDEGAMTLKEYGISKNWIIATA